MPLSGLTMPFRTIIIPLGMSTMALPKKEGNRTFFSQYKRKQVREPLLSQYFFKHETCIFNSISIIHITLSDGKSMKVLHG